MTIGYMVPAFPAQTHIFFWRESRALGELGIDTRFVSTRRPPAATISHRWAPEAMSRTHYLVSGSPKDNSRAALRLLKLGPARLFALLAAATAESGRSPRRLLDATASLFMAANLVNLAHREGWSHVHVGSCGRSAEIAALASQLGTGLTYSLSMLGPDFATYGSNHAFKWRTARFGLFQSRQLLAQGERVLGADMPRHIALAPVGVDMDVMRRESPYRTWRPGEVCRLYSCGRLNRVKGHEYVIDALAILRKQGVDAVLEIAGEDELGGGGYRRQIEAHVRSREMERHVTLLGAVSEETNRERYAQAHVYVMGSLNEAAGAVAAMEAMAMEVPVVMTRAGATAELIQHGVDGLLVPPGDAQSLAASLLTVLGDPDLASRLGRAGRESIAQRYSHRISAAAIARLLDETS